jgi:small subunit ribosomal protein S16
LLVIRLSRTGRRNQPKYRLMVAEDRSKLTGKPVAMLGHYIPTDKDKPLVIDKEAVQMWLSRGAQPSNTVAKILNGQGFDLAVHKYQPGKPKKAPKEAPVSKQVSESEGAGEAAPAESTEEVAEEAVAEAETQAAEQEVAVEEVATETAAEEVSAPEEVAVEEAAAEVAEDEAAA